MMTARIKRAGTEYRAEASAISRWYREPSATVRRAESAAAGAATVMAAVTAIRTRDRGLKRSMPVLQGKIDTGREFPHISRRSGALVRDGPGGSLTRRS